VNPDPRARKARKATKVKSEPRARKARKATKVKKEPRASKARKARRDQRAILVPTVPRANPVFLVLREAKVLRAKREQRVLRDHP
jgi:hypothetical protein